MSRFRAVLDRLGGPGAVTWWAFAISLADRLIGVSVQPINTQAPPSARIAATFIAQLAMFAPLVLLRFTLLRDPLRPRPWIALLGFSVADVIRALVFDRMLHEIAGIPLYPALRVFSGFLPTIIPLLITAYVVNTLRERRIELAALLIARDRLTQSRNTAESAIQQRNEDLVATVRTVMDRELESLSQEQGAAAIDRLQRTASDVVRPLSHELATSFESQEGAAPTFRPVRLGWRQVVGDASLDRPLAPAITTALITAVWVPTAIVLAGARLALIVSLPLLFVLMCLANALLRRLLPSLQPVGRLAAVAGSCLAISIAVGGAIRIMVGDWPSGPAITFAGMYYLLVATTGTALIYGVLASRVALLADTARANDELQAQVLRTRQIQWFHQRALARALHGPVQSAVTASALRLAKESQEGTISPALVESVRSDLVSALDVLNAPESEVASIDQSISRIVTTWDGVCEVRASIDDAANTLIADDLVTRACVIDILTDAVSNAVRHGKAEAVSIRISSPLDVLVIDVQDNGTAVAEGLSTGLGSALLDECALTWSLTRRDDGHLLHAVLPLVPTLATP